MLKTKLFEAWAEDIRRRFEIRFGEKAPRAPNVIQLETSVQERMMRCGVEARFFGVEEHDDLAILAHHTLLRDAVRQERRVNRPHYP